MKKFTRRNFLQAAGIAAGAAALAACGDKPASSTPASSGAPASSGSTETKKEFKKCKIGVGFYSDHGPAYENGKKYLEALGAAMNAELTYVTLSSTDEQANLDAAQKLIAANVDGIMFSMDSSMTTIIDECESAEVYLAGFLADYDSSFRNTYDQVFKNPYFLGTVADGSTSDNLVAGHDFFDSLIEYNKAHADAPITHVSMCTFPTFAFPQHAVYVQQFVADVEEYNKTAAAPITVDPFDGDTDVLMFRPMDSTYLSKHPGIQAIVSFCAAQFVYPTLVSANQNGPIKIFAAGYTEGDENDFAETGNGTFQQEIVSAIEAYIYPFVLLINKINGVAFPDMPEVAERVSVSRLIVNSQADLDIFKEGLYLSGDVSKALFSPEEVAEMTALNPNATYAQLLEALDHMTIEDIAAKMGK